MVSGTKRRVIYTALIGDYESFSAPDYAVREDTDLICFTDSDQLSDSSWKVIKINPRFPEDNIRSARYLKIMGPIFLAEYSESLWLDNTVLLKVEPDVFLDALLMDEDLALPMHSFRDSVAAEFDAVNAAGYDDVTRIYEQLFHYAHTSPDVLMERPFWTAIMARRHTDDVKVLMTCWWEHVLRYSRRDQLSFNYVLHKVGLGFTGLDINNDESEFHKWPVNTARNYNKTKSNTVYEAIFSAPISRLAKLENELGYLRKEASRMALVNQNDQPIPKDLFQQLLKQLLGQGGVKIVQVGVCDGVINDPIYDLVMQDPRKSEIVLIEPQETLISIIKDNYRNHKNAHVFNCAIGKPGTLVLYALEEKLYSIFDRKYLKDSPQYRVPAGFVSSNIDHVRSHVAGNLPPEIDLNEAIKEFEVPSRELAAVLVDLGWQSFDVLQVDAEGMDDEVVKYCNVDRFKPKIINFEHMHLSVDRKMSLYEMLSSMGYKVYEYSASDALATRLNINFS